MIEIKNLSKIYNNETSNPVYALDDVSFKLPDKGLIFILGKSGSGKSTLLNMLGMLDKPTKGEIILNNNVYSTFTENKINGYRVDHIGFIFQNFCLLENMTVIENIRLAYNMTSKEEDPNLDFKIRIYLKEYGLERYENTLVNQLSGGQCQRVAVIRALIKNPDMILADEPTGNLDSKSSTFIFDNLSKISKDRLVVVVSHDLANSWKYADRIIEIQDGKVKRDIIRNENYKELNSNQISLSANTEIDEKEYNEVSKIFKEYNLELVRKENQFINYTEDIKGNDTVLPINDSVTKFSNSFFVAKKFIKSNMTSSIFNVLLITLIIVLLCLSQIFVNFDTESAINSAVEKIDVSAFVMTKGFIDNKGSVDKAHIIEIKDEDISKFYEEGYEGDVYKLINQPLMITEYYRLEGLSTIDKADAYDDFFAKTGLGTLICNKEFLLSVYGDEYGDFEVLAGNIDTMDPLSIIVTDYFAESYLYWHGGIKKNFSNSMYNSLIGAEPYNRYKIGAIIGTGYKDRYQDLIDKFLESLDADPITAKRIIKEILNSDGYDAFCEERDTILNAGFTFNPDYYEQFLNSKYANFAYFSNVKMTDLNSYDASGNVIEDMIDIFKARTYHYSSGNLKPGEVYMSINHYCNLFNMDLYGTNDPRFEPKKIRIDNYEFKYDIEEIDSSILPNYSKEFTVVGLVEGDGGGGNMLYFSPEDFKDIKRLAYVPYALYFSNISHSYNIFENGRDIGFYNSTSTFETINTVCDLINIFDKFSLIVSIFLILMSLLIIVSYSLRSVRLHRYNIGILRALGSSIKSVELTLILEISFICLLTIILSTISTIILSYIANIVMRTGLAIYYNQKSIASLEIFTLKPSVLFGLIGLIFSIGIIAILVSFKPLTKIAPAEILKTGD